MSFGPLAPSNASHAEITSNFDVLLAVFCQREKEINALSRLTSIDQRHSVIDRLLRVGFEDFRHVWERRLPFKSISEITMCTHSAQKPTGRSNRWMQRLADLIR